ncbi:hypothetical protein PV328_011207 [Microctonus aethiopoides]|uniref:Uncharacterized protein n=1 Tax=Microctonus aethiopoides TaxID=144406 RepID=A0AA39C415_9HYME|nr:hypothetical protein PV328_011207 [Microctonus aethiopoides]
MLKFITTFVTLVTVSSGYYNHGTAIHSPYNSHNYYGNNANYAQAIGSSSGSVLHSYKHITPISTHIQSKATVRPSLPTSINPYSTFHGDNYHQNNHLDQPGYIQSGAKISSTASSAAYLPPPTISPPSISYNNNFIAPSIQNLSHGVKAVPSYANYAKHNNGQINNLQHNRFPVPYSPISSHISEPMSADILENMDPSVNPCDNFYKFTCGQFLNSTFATPDKKRVNWSSDMYEKIVIRLGGLLNSKISENDIELFRQTKQLYRQCLDRKTITEQQDKNVLDILNKFGGWPVVMGDTWNSTDIDWTNTPAIFSYAELLSYQYPVKNFTNYSDDSVYYNFLVKYAVKLGAEKDRAKKEIMEAIKFENDLLNISLSAFYVDETNESNPDNFMTIDEMMKQWPTIEWLTYINSVFSMISDPKKINKNEKVIVNYPTFITNFEKFISSTPKRVLINYAFGRVIIDLLERTNPGSSIFFENEQLGMNDKNDWRDCVKQTVDNLPEIVTALYVRNFIKDDEKLEAMNITSNIKKELIKTINEAKWLDVETRKNASHKILSTNTKIGYPDLYRNDNEITEIFRDLQIGESTYLHNVWKIHRFNTAFTLRGMRDKEQYFQTWMPALSESWRTINAVYYEPDNVFTVSPNYLQRPAIDKRQPSYMNYGRIGYIIGHELTHIIDTFRNFVNKDRITTDLLIKTSAENFNKRVDCIIDQYNNYTLNGKLSRREIIADNVGVKMSYYAYKNWSSQHEPEPILPGLNYTPSQMFWISYASNECTLINRDYLIDIAKKQMHPPNQYRVLGSLSNIPEFSKDFNCPLSSPMNPKTKCTIW